jgi:purine-binding chemotaxis protein CheW
MPTTPESEWEARILEERAQRLARPAVSDAQQTAYDTVVVVTIGNERLGIPARSLRVISERFSVTPVFGTPPWLAGITHIGGELISVVHLGHWLGEATRREGARLAVVEGPRGALGLLIDEVLGFREVMESDLSDTLTPNAAKQRFTRAITKDLVTLLDVTQLLESEEIVVSYSGGGVAAARGQK